MDVAAIEKGEQVGRYVGKAGRGLQGAPRQEHNVPTCFQILAHLAQNVIAALLAYGASHAVRAGLLQMLDNCAAGREGDLHHPGNLIPATQRFFQLQHSGQVHPVGQYQHRLCRYAFCPFYP